MITRWILLLVLGFTAFLYWNGLNGPFLFDDHVHISQNRWVQIDSLSWDNLVQAWNSSFSAFPSNRPLAQLTFGLNHALGGNAPWWFKATNLILHLATGVAVFVFVNLAYRAILGSDADLVKANRVALLAAAIWLVSPLHVSTVLYTVQRMTQLSALAVLIGLSCYIWGRIRLAKGKPGLVWMLISAPVALIGFLGKENAVLMPLFLLVCEATLLRNMPLGNHSIKVKAIWGLYIAVPLILGLVYFSINPALTYYDERPFTMSERVLTQTRVLWLYLQFLFTPNLSEYGLFHDGLVVSKSLLTPPTTLLAIASLSLLFAAALLLRKRIPIFSFAVFFYLAGHALESSFLALELMFEHRNYLPSVGPILLLAYVINHVLQRQAKIAGTLGIIVVLAYGSTTYLRSTSWSSYESFILTTAENHPDSPRSNFLAAQLLISSLQNSTGNRTEIAQAAETFLKNGIAADAQCINCYFGKIVLKLHLDQQPATKTVENLADALQNGDVGATKLSISQFSYLVKWYRSDGMKLKEGHLESIFNAALTNPKLNHTGRAGIESAYREYYEFVANDLNTALHHAQAAINVWPQQWSYHMHKVSLLRKLGRYEEALSALDAANTVADNAAKTEKTEEARELIHRKMIN